MGWENVTNKLKKTVNCEFISCREVKEINNLVTVIREEFPWMGEPEIRKAIAQCCAAIPAPPPRYKFFRFLRDRLGIG